MFSLGEERTKSGPTTYPRGEKKITKSRLKKGAT
jgi:hypothetical protein